MHDYQIIINQKPNTEPISYTFGKTNTFLQIGLQKACITFSMRTPHTQDDLLSFRCKPFRDAYRKVYLLYALSFDCGLKVNKVSVIIDGEGVDYGPDTPHFPFMFSMIDCKKLNLSPEWKRLAPYFLNATKSAAVDDLRFASAYAFLASKNRLYEIDRFLYLWNSINSLYSFVGSEIEHRLTEKYGLERIPNNSDLKFIRKDEKCVCSLAYLIYPSCYSFKESKRIEELWNGNYTAERFLEKMTDPERMELYDAALAELSGTPLPEKFTVLRTRAAEFQVPLYTFILLIYAYHWRCNLFHGNRTTVLVSAYNEYEISVLGTLNCFLERYLNSAIPTLFTGEILSEERFERILSYLRFSLGDKDFQKAIQKKK